MPKIGYKFENIESVLVRIQSANPYPTSAMLNDLKKELNKFFTGTECVDIIFTKNTDKLFFGMCVYPIVDKFIVQWEEQKKVYPKAIDLGSIF